jgi:hypothetical protein
MFFKIQAYTKTKDNEVNNMVESYLNRQLWEQTYSNPKNQNYNGK